MSRVRVLTVEMALLALFRGCALRTSHLHPRNAGGSSTGHAMLCVGIESRSLVETEPFDRHAEVGYSRAEPDRQAEVGYSRMEPDRQAEVSHSRREPDRQAEVGYSQMEPDRQAE